MKTIAQATGALFAVAMAVAPAWAEYTSTVFNRPYTYVFRGTENANWATVGNWYTTSDNGTNWTQYSGAVPGAPSSNLWDAVLLDGALMDAITVGDDGYKTITMNDTLEGWNTPIGVANGVHLKISSINKIQGQNRAWRVDENSKITVTTFGVSGNTSETGHNFYVDAPEGITFQNAFTGGGTPGASCYFGKRGSIKFEQGTGGGTYTVASVALDCGDGFTQKHVLSRTLIAYASKTATMTVSNASVTGSYQDGSTVACTSKSSTPTTDDPVGTYQLTVGDTGVVITYVATEALEEGSLLMGYSRAASEPVQDNSTVALALSSAELASGQVTFTSPNVTEPTGVTWLCFHAGTALEETPTATFVADGQSGTWTVRFTANTDYEAITLDVSGAGIPAAAKTVQPAAATNGVAFGKSSGYLAISADGTEWQGAKVTGATNTPMIFGGLGFGENGPINRNLLLTVTGGDFDHIYGGHNADDWNSGDRTRNLTGNTRVEMSGGTVNYLLGGNFKDGAAKPVTLGNIDVVVSGTAEVKGSIFGGSVTAHNKGTTVGSESQRKQVTVKVKNLQADNSAALVKALRPGYIAGGDTYMSNASPTSNIYGDTAVVIDLPAETTGTFVKSLVGGSALLEGGDSRNTPQLKVNGNSSVTIDAPSTVTFSQTVMGGPAFAGSSGSAVTTGNAMVTIRGGKYTGTIYAGGSGASASVTGNATLTLESGDFSEATLAPCGNGSSVGGTSTLAIAGDVDLSTTTLSDFSTFSVAEGKTLILGTKRLKGMPLTAGANAGWATLAVTLTEAEVTAGYAELCGYSGETLPTVSVTLPDAADASAWSAMVIADKLVLSTGVKQLTWTNGAANWSDGLTGFNPGDNVTFRTTTGSEAEGVAVPSGIAAGEMAVNGAYTFTLADFGAGFSASKITVSSSGKATFEPQAVRYVRLQLDNANGGTGDNAVPGASELILTKGSTAVAWPLGTTIKQVNLDGSEVEPTWAPGGNEKVNALIDGVWNGSGNVLTYTNPEDGSRDTYSGDSVSVNNNKWWPHSNPKAYAVITLGAAVDFDGYKLMTTDHDPRSAKNWTLEVSADRETWFVADSRTNWDVPNVNSFYVYDESGSTIFPVVDPVTIVSAPIEVQQNGTLGGSATLTGAVTFADGAVLDVTAGAPTVTGEVTASGSVTVVLPEGTVLQPVLTTATTGLASSFSRSGYEFHYREGTYWAIRTIAKALTAEVTVTSDLSNLTWKPDADSEVVARADLLKLWDFALNDLSATLNTATAAAVTIDCATVPALTLSGSAAVTLSAADGVSPTIASLTVAADSTVAAALLNRVTGSTTVESGKTLSLTGDGTIGSVISGEGALRIASGTTTLSQANTYTGGTTIETGAQVTVTNATALGTAGSITGGGVIFAGDNLIPTLTRARFGASWTGTVRFSGAKTNLNLNNFGSTVELNGASGYVTPDNGTTFSTAKVNLEGDGWRSTNGNGNANLTFTGALGGSGTLTLSGNKPADGTCYRFASAPDFTGAITVANNYALSIGDTSVAISSSDGSKRGSITLASAVQVAAEKTWSARSGLYINSGAVVSGSGTLTATEGDITVASGANVSSFTGTYTVAAGRKVVFNTSVTNPTVTGSGSVAVNGAGSVLTYTSTTRPTYDIEVGDGATLVLALTEDEAMAVYTASNVTVATGGKVRFVRPDKWVVEETSNVYDPERASYVAEWTGSGDDTNWATVANWACNGQAVTTAPGMNLASLTVAAGKMITLPGAVTVGSLTASGDFTLAGAADTSLTAQAVTLGGAVTLNAPLVLNLASALETDKAITVNASGALTTSGTVSLTNASCAFSGPLTVESGTLTWRHDDTDEPISGAVTVKEGATFATVSNCKHSLTLTGNLSGAGTVRVKVPTAGSQHDGARFLNLQGACAGFTGTVELEMTVTGASSNNETMPRRTSVVIKPSDNVFNGSINVVKVAGSSPFADTSDAVADGLWPYSKIFFANDCTFAGTIGGQGTVYIGRTGNRDNTKLLADNGTPSVGKVTLTNQLATYAGSVAIPDAGSTLLIQPTEAVTFAGKLSGEGKLDVETAQAVTLTGDLSGFTGALKLIEGSSLTLDTASTMALSGQLNGYGALTLGGSHGKPTVALSGANGDYYGVVTVASNAVLTNAGSSATVPFGKGRIENNGTVKLMGTTGTYGSGQLPPTSGSGNIDFCAGSTSRIAGAITTTGTVTFEPANGEGAAAAAVTFVSSGDFSEKVASIKGASVVVGEGVPLAKDETSMPLITIAAGESLSGSGTINVPVAFEDATTATMPPEANLTFTSALTVPKNVTLPGTITLGEGAVLSGAGALSGTVTLNSGVIIDATKSTASGYLKLMGSSVTLGETLKVKASKLTNVLDVQTSVGLDLAKVSLTDDSTIPTGAKLMTSVFETVNTSITTLKFFVPPTVPKAPTESPRDTGVDTQIAQAAETYAGGGMIISEVTTITGTGSNGTGTREINGSSLFENVLTLTPVSVKDDGTYTAKVTVAYDFGVSDITVKSANLSDDPKAAAQLYVVVCAKVSNGNNDATAADYAGDTTVSLWLNGGAPTGAVALDADTLFSKFGIKASNKGEKWFAVPVTSLDTGTNAFTVSASQAEATP